MVPLTPVLPPTYHSPSTHPKLLTEEPILTITLLTISSRYMQLTGRGGRSRSYAIHEKLWTYLRGMIERMVWGQEQFGSGAGGSAASDEAETQTSSTAPWRGLKKGSLRTLGTVESLMLLTEWHPRALHFPPGDDGDELIVKEERWPAEDAGADVADGEGGFRSQKGIGGKRIENWLEPAWRSDRMCWMLLGNALALAFELGVFDRTPEMPSPGGDTQRPDRESLSYRLREQRVQKLLYVYVTQLAGRLEWTSMVGNLPGLRDMGRRLGEHVHVDVVRANAADLSDGSPMDDAILNCWIDITDLMKSGNERLFPTRKVTRELIRSGSYVSLLEDFAPMLRGWRENFNALRMPDYIRCVLEIEFEYVRVYINSLALQAVVERCTSNAGNGATPGPTTDAATPNPRDRTGSIAFSSLMGFQDQEYIKEVVDASRNLLRTVVEGLLPGDYLKHCPVRTYFRIVSGAMFLLKTFALGAKEDDVAISLGLMDSTVEALRECIVDDVHLGVRFADLLEVLTMRIRSRFVRMATGGGNRGESRSPAPAHRAQDQAEQATWQVADADPDGGNNTGYLLPPRGDGTRTPNPLFGISTASVDPDDLNVSIMPPPPGSFNFTPSYNSNNVDANGNLTIGGGVSDDGSAYPADWLGLDLNPLLNYGGGGVGAGGGASQAYGSGVSVGGFDLLEVLLNDMEGNGV
ncbi:MAG: hypothetical protein M1832_004483 [Thelocarpon impressellum]|nr:MAG: hypothetical protein M1832_004483 [Thelocarpon impressellum]